MFKNLLLLCVTAILILTSCSENSTTPDLTNGLNFTMSGKISGKFSSSTATAVTANAEDKQVLTITGTMSINGNNTTAVITVFSPAQGTFDLSLQNLSDPPIFCTINIAGGSTYLSTNGTLKLNEYGTSVGSKVKGNFNFDLYDSELNELKITNGTFNLIHVTN